MNFREKYGPYAFINVASSGIGKEFALQLAGKGLDLVLVARRKKLPEVLAEEIRKQNNVKVKVLTPDLVSSHFMEEVERDTENLGIGLLINNAGIKC